MNKLNQVLPEPFYKAFQIPTLAEKFLDNFGLFSDIDIQSENPRIKEQSYKALVTALSDIAPKMANSSIRNILETNPDFALNLQQIQKVYGKADSQHTMHFLACPEM